MSKTMDMSTELATEEDKVDGKVPKSKEKEYIELQSLLKSTINSHQFTTIQGVVIGKITSIKDAQVYVDYQLNPTQKSILAAATLIIQKRDIGKDVALLFENGDARRPIIMGLMFNQSLPKPEINEVKIDNEQLLLTAKREIVLKCGTSSITLTKAGKILLRGKYLLSRSSGVNRIKGGSVQIN